MLIDSHRRPVYKTTMLGLFASTLFLSAFLIFWVQPMFAKMILPLLGGSPSVWNTSMVFFQSTLLAGYLYADVSVRRIPVRLQPLVHGGLLLAAVFFLPVALAPAWRPPAASNPVASVLLLMLTTVGLPALVVSSTAPLVQAWFARTGHAAAGDPYFLYSASNFGSMLALLGYPTIIEPALRLDGQSRIWAAGFALLALALLGCAAALLRARAGGEKPPQAPAPDDGAASAAPTARERGMWLLLSFVPSSLLLGVTMHITTDIATVPFLWVLPLALYLSTFVIAFSRRPVLSRSFARRLQPAALAALAGVLFLENMLPALTFSVHLLAFFATALACHSELAARRPAADHLTNFYLWLSIGGVLGGIFNALVAPLVFTTVAEYPLVILGAAFLRPGNPVAAGRRRWLEFAIPAGVFLLLWQGPPLVLASRFQFQYFIVKVVLIALCCVAVYALRSRALGFGLGIAAVLGVGFLNVNVLGRGVEHRERNFFGVISIVRDGSTRVFKHGSVLHGAQSLEPELRRTPLAYHSLNGPLGEIFSAYRRVLAGRSIAVGGLGAGATAAYGQRGQKMVFYELDPAVERIARDPRYFTFLADSPADIRVEIGDARLRLAEAAPGAYSMIILDVFSSDAVPVHLLTREALRLYLDKLAPGGILAFNISNVFLDLQPVVHALAADAGLISAIRFGASNPKASGGYYQNLPSTWVIMAREMNDLIPLQAFPDWFRTEGRAGMGPWTDGYSNIFRVFNPW